MLVCHCKRVSDRVIRAAVRSGARSTSEVGDCCGAGTGCGGCRPAVDELIAAESAGPAELTLLRARKEDV